MRPAPSVSVEAQSSPAVEVAISRIATKQQRLYLFESLAWACETSFGYTRWAQERPGHRRYAELDDWESRPRLKVVLGKSALAASAIPLCCSARRLPPQATRAAPPA